MNVKKLAHSLTLSFENESLMKQAFTHSSYANEHPRKQLSDNERLEFLGDAVLELAVSDYLYRKYPTMSEGDLSKLRANIVCEESLFHFAEKINLGDYVLLGKGEERTGGRKRQALLADVFEAFLGALYLDQGMEVCQWFLEDKIFPYITKDAFSHTMDFKTKLQEIIQKKRNNKLRYAIVDEAGPPHRKQFVAEVIVNESIKTKGTGTTKKEAEQIAAKKMIEKLRQQNK